MSVRQELTAIRERADQILALAQGPPACRHGICHPDGPCNCATPGASAVVSDDATHASRLFPLVSLMPLRSMLKAVPTEYRQIGPTRVTVACVCRRALRIYESGFVECSCGRVFCWTGRRLYVMRPDLETSSTTDPKEGS